MSGSDDTQQLREERERDQRRVEAEVDSTATDAEATASAKACAAAAAGLREAAQKMAAWAEARLGGGPAVYRPGQQPPLPLLRAAADGMRALTARWQPDEAAVAAFAAVCYRREPRGCHSN